MYHARLIIAFLALTLIVPAHAQQPAQAVAQLAAADKPVQVDIRKNGVWILKLAPNNPTIASLNIASNGDPMLTVLELQASLLEQTIVGAQESMGSDNNTMRAMKKQLDTLRRQLVLRRAQATKKTLAKTIPSKKR